MKVAFPLAAMLRACRSSLAEIGQGILQNAPFRFQRVQGIRVGNTEIPDNKLLKVSLQRIHGVGDKRAQKILADLSIVNKPTKDLTITEMQRLREEVSKYLTGEDLRRRVKSDVQRLIDIQCYRGYRHADTLPCRGQRTKTNARTRKTHSKRDIARQEMAERMYNRQVKDQGK
ncbi:hypothetical protein Tsubulata_004881 [Turnera subulata]|uniref:Ribosomal protein S13 n=1 Tax=Turnera subulata TaxID=218843 RepID=A0A9Q0GH48_9ROSI|nr:hypothetical protein Tsubulata_004881 [Turnera subulata]